MTILQRKKAKHRKVEEAGFEMARLERNIANIQIQAVQS